MNILDIPIVADAYEFATMAHRSVVNEDGTVGQKRKYTNEPYEIHPYEVAVTVSESCHNDPVNIAVAMLHDVVEDTSFTFQDIHDYFINKGYDIETVEDLVQGVREVTDISQKSDGNRSVRKNIDKLHAWNASARRQTVKLADIINNATSIFTRDKGFAKVWGKEKAAMVEGLTLGDKKLQEIAENLVRRYR